MSFGVDIAAGCADEICRRAAIVLIAIVAIGISLFGLGYIAGQHNPPPERQEASSQP